MLAVSCATKTAPASTSPQSNDACRLAADSGSAAESFTIALPEPVSLEHLRAPSNDSERLLFRQLFDTLIRLDCNRQPVPALADEWAPDTSRRIWTFSLRKGARLISGSGITPAEIVSSWKAEDPWPAALGVDSAVALEDRRLVVYLRAPADSVPEALADPFFAVVPPEGAPSFNAPQIHARRHSLPRLDFVRVAGADPRDALDQGAGLLVTRDPALMDYAANRREFDAIPLPWSRTYVLLQMPGVVPVEGLSGDSVRSSLARDAVSAFARAAEPPYWWAGLDCLSNSATRLPHSVSSRIVYLRSDDAARGLAERIVALYGNQLSLKSAGLDATDLATAVRNGSERGYLLALPHHPLAACRELSGFPPGVAIQPLVDTRAHVIVRRGAPGMTVDWDGTVRVLGLSESREPPQ